MKTNVLLIGSCLLLGCHHSTSFDQATWLRNPAMEDTRNPRAYMVQDVIKNQLKTGMSREAVTALLGPPYKAGVELRLPKGVDIPDSLSASNINSFEPKTQKKYLAAINAFYRRHAQPDTLLLYPVGWSTIDPDFLVVKLTGKGQADSYWVEQH